MKKKIVTMLFTLGMIASFAACGSKTNVAEDESTQESVVSEGQEDAFPQVKRLISEDMALKDIPVEEYVNLCDYTNLNVQIVKATAEEIEASTTQLYLNMYPAEQGITDRVVEMGDTANIDFEGKKDGVAFQGGTAKGSNLTIGSGQFISGFEDGLVGVMPGETVDLNLTFPEGYGNADLAGQDVVFTVTVNYIIPAGIDDAIVAQMGLPDITTGDQMRDYVENYLASYYRSNAEADVVGAFMNACVFDTMPKVLVDKYANTLKSDMEAAAAESGMDVETYMSTYYGMDIETYASTYAERSLKLNMACQALANKEELNISDAQLDTMLADYASQSGATVEDFLAEASKEEYREYFMYEKVLAFLVDQIK